MAGAVPDLFDGHTGTVKDGDQKVRRRRVRLVVEVVVGFEFAVQLAGREHRQIRMTVQVSDAHAASVENQTVIEQRAVAIRCCLHFLEFFAKKAVARGPEFRLEFRRERHKLRRQFRHAS